MKLQFLARDGNLEGLRSALRDRGAQGINEFDSRGYTPLMHAVESPQANANIVSMLLEHGADLHLTSCPQSENHDSVISLALRNGDPEKVSLLVEKGADLLYKT